MKLGKKIVSLMIVLVMIATTIFSVNISNAAALTNEQKAQELVSKMTLEEKIGQKIMLSFRSGWTMKDGTKISSVQNINDEIYEIIGKYDIGSVIKIKHLQTEKRELLQSLEMYYKVFFLGETIEDDGEMIGKES